MKARCSKGDEEVGEAECGGQKKSDCDRQGLDFFAKRVAEEGCGEKGNEGDESREDVGQSEHLLGFSIGIEEVFYV